MVQNNLKLLVKLILLKNDHCFLFMCQLIRIINFHQKRYLLFCAGSWCTPLDYDKTGAETLGKLYIQNKIYCINSRKHMFNFQTIVLTQFQKQTNQVFTPTNNRRGIRPCSLTCSGDHILTSCLNTDLQASYAVQIKLERTMFHRQILGWLCRHVRQHNQLMLKGDE